MDMTKMSPKVRDKFLPRELAALMEVKHRYAIRVFDIFRMSHKVYVFMEYASNGDLAAYVKKNKILKEPLACVWFTQTSEAVHYLHTDVKMSHRDIKLDNILLNDSYEAKLTDFGFANLITDENMEIADMVSETYCGTLPYYSPQLVTKKPYNPFKADVWAMGLVLYAMLCNRFPFHFQDLKKLYKEQTDHPNFIRTRFLSFNSASVRNLLEMMLNPNEKCRPMMAEVLAHRWVVLKGKCND